MAMAGRLSAHQQNARKPDLMMFLETLRTGAKALALLGTALAATGAQATEAEARALLKGMSDYVASLSSIETNVDTALEIVTPEMQKISFTSSSTMRMTRPNQVRLERKGSFANIELFFDGKTLSVRELDSNVYAQVAAPGTTEQLIDAVHDRLGMAVPGADLLLVNSYAILMADVLDAKVIGQGVIGGEVCDHIAFRNFDTDWQLWIKAGPEKSPCKMIITSKLVGMAPQYTVHVRSWKSNPKFAPGTFVFTPKPGEKQVTVETMSNIDEVPATPTPGARK
jgi:hypothetical protein